MTNKLAVLLILSMCCAVLVVGQRRSTRFDPDGTYWIHGEHPEGFSDFGGINLNAKRVRRFGPAGLSLNNGKNFRFKTISVQKDNFTFKTVTLSNISYTFSGKFLKGGIFESAGLDDEVPVMEGVLTKYNGTKKVAEANLKFVYFAGT